MIFSNIFRKFVRKIDSVFFNNMGAVTADESAKNDSSSCNKCRCCTWVIITFVVIVVAIVVSKGIMLILLISYSLELIFGISFWGLIF